MGYKIPYKNFKDFFKKTKMFERIKKFYGSIMYGKKELAFGSFPTLEFWNVYDGDYDNIKPDLYCVYQVSAYDEDGEKYHIKMYGVEENGEETYNCNDILAIIPDDEYVLHGVC